MGSDVYSLQDLDGIFLVGFCMPRFLRTCFAVMRLSHNISQWKKQYSVSKVDYMSDVGKIMQCGASYGRHCFAVMRLSHNISQWKKQYSVSKVDYMSDVGKIMQCGASCGRPSSGRSQSAAASLSGPDPCYAKCTLPGRKCLVKKTLPPSQALMRLVLSCPVPSSPLCGFHTSA